MPVGDTRSDLRLIASGAYLEIRPPTNEEWIIHNLWHGASAELFFTDGTNYIKGDTTTGEGAWLNFNFHVTNTRFLALRNRGPGGALMGFDGIVSKEGR